MKYLGILGSIPSFYVMEEEQILKQLNKESTGKKGSRSQLISEKMKENNYVASHFTYIVDYDLYKFCQGVNKTGELTFGAERFSPSYEDY